MPQTSPNQLYKTQLSLEKKVVELIASQITKKNFELEAFFNESFLENSPLFYNSVDVRNSGFKISAVDTNCFPAGFNNLSAKSIELAQKTADDFLSKNFPEAKNIAIIPESHTRNLNYLTNVKNLQKILSFKRVVKIGSLIPEIDKPTNFQDATGDLVELNPVIKNQNKILVNDCEVGLVILNNDLSEGVPEILKDCTAPIIPSTKIGWYNRSKFNHFTKFNEIAKQISKILEVDPWLITTFVDICENINFKDRVGIDELAQKVDKILQKTKEKYLQYNIDKEPYCFVKADSGTYGMAVWKVTSANDILEINKKDRNKMSATKGSIANNRVIIQEGIPTIDKIDNMPAEPLIYLVDGQVIGNLYRVNQSRDDLSSLNAAGAIFFDSMDLDMARIEPKYQDGHFNMVNSLIARIAAIAATKELL